LSEGGGGAATEIETGAGVLLPLVLSLCCLNVSAKEFLLVSFESTGEEPGPRCALAFDLI
jgi:hypothetical protein